MMFQCPAQPARGSGGCTSRRPGRAFSVARAERVHEIQRWTASTDWVISREIAHPPLVSEEHFVAIQAIHSAPTPTDGIPRRYVLAEVICCGVCGRIMDSHWIHSRPGYRCRHGHTSTRTRTSAQPTILYIREDHLLDRIRHDRGLHRRRPALRSPDPENSPTTYKPTT
ncbi:zinc ribbon domain-containing protein [Micromonospora taraxaci]|uniref:zinc ribbon domain-containing protein n=2 Tax=Micromonospora taraxaci TaxID=1316803 RepID=UPI003C2C340B